MPELDTGDYKPYKEWIGRKSAALRRPRLDCGHPNTGEVYFHVDCDRLSCSDECAKLEHDCSAYGGAKDGTEEESEPAEAAPPVSVVQSATSSWVSFADVAAGPVAGADAALDLRRRVQDGVAPAPDRVTEVARAEFLRQGITEYEEDDVRYRYRGGVWHVEPGGYRSCMERLAPPVDAAPDPDPAPTRSKLSEIAAALRARARRGGTK